MMTNTNFQQLANFIWSVADLLRGPYRPPQYERVMLPLTVGRRQLSWPPGDNYLGRWGAGKFWCQLLRLLMLLVVSSEGLRAREASLA